MSTNELVSIIIPLYNKSKFIEQTLQSIMNQTYTNWECVIVDDGSIDGSLKIVEKFLNKIEVSSKFKIIQLENRGQAFARNQGIKASNGDYIAFLDADDLWDLNKLKFQVRDLKKKDNLIGVVCPYFIFNDSKPSRSLRFVKHYSFSRVVKRWSTFEGFGLGLESNLLIRRSVFNQLGLFDENLSTSSGLDLALRIRSSYKIGFSRSTFMAYRISSNQWHKGVSQLTLDILKIQAKFTKDFTNWRKMLIQCYLDVSSSKNKFAFICSGVLSKRAAVTYTVVLNVLMRNLIAFVLGLFNLPKFLKFMRGLDSGETNRSPL